MLAGEPEAVLAGVKKSQIEGRSLTQIAWTRFKRDKVAMAGGVVVVHSTIGPEACRRFAAAAASPAGPLPLA